MIFGYLTLFTALIISLSAAVYSILGLTAIFAAAFWPIVVLGGSLEFGKIVTTLWLHKYWSRAEIQYKIYLCSAVAILMLLTSMGVFGFLSKAHLDQAVPSGDVAAKVAIYDEKIKTERDNIEAARRALQQMDSQVDARLSRGDSEQSAERAVQIRRGQAKERAKLQKEISNAQATISKLNEERAPIASEMRKVEAEVGPIKYIAALVYGDNPEANALEQAVRWVIILIVIVFDPLALTLLLAATKTFEWERKIDIFAPKKRNDEELDDVALPENDSIAPFAEDMPVAGNKKIPAEEELEKKPRWGGFGFPLGSVFSKKEEPTVNDSAEQSVIDTVSDERPGDYVVRPDMHDDDPHKEAKRAWKLANPNDTLKKYEKLYADGQISTLPWEAPKYGPGILTNNTPSGAIGEVKGFGIAFPKDAVKGDMYLRIDQIPSRLYKFNGRNWIEVNKSLSDQHAYDKAYIDHLISKIESGEYDPDLLSDAERDSIEHRLNNKG